MRGAPRRPRCLLHAAPCPIFEDGPPVVSLAANRVFAPAGITAKRP